MDSRTHLADGTHTTPCFISVPSTDLTTPKGMGTQALFGQRFDLISSENGMAHGALYSIVPGKDRIDYIGTVPSDAVSDASHAPTHCVPALSAAIFRRPDIKSRLMGSLPRNAVMAGHMQGDFLHLHGSGYIHLKHLRPIQDASARMFTELAKDMLGLPYIWGGTGHIGVDCSGLVQSALAATGVDAPRDADQQEASLGRSVSDGKRQIGDLLFWPGHVGIVIEGDKLLHANAHHMCVAIESVAQAVSRIGDVRTVKRLT